MQSKIDYEALLECAEELNNIALDFQLIFQSVTETIKKVHLNNYWTGKASNHYQEKYKKIEPFLEEAYNQVKNYSLMLNRIIENYKKLEQQILGTIG